MEFDDLQKAWQGQKAPERVTISAEALLREVRRNELSLRATLIWRDVREVSAAVLLAAWFSFKGLRDHAWSDCVCAALCAGVGVFIIIDRLARKGTQRSFTGTLKSCLESSLAEVNHQIWLLRNVFWWYLLPLLIASAISMCNTNARRPHFNQPAAIGAMITALLVAWFFRWVYRLNQAAVARTLEPRRRELEELMTGLK
jgi:Na+/proline symporter